MSKIHNSQLEEDTTGQRGYFGALTKIKTVIERNTSKQN